MTRTQQPAQEPNSYLPKPFRGRTNEQLLEKWPHAFRFRDPEFVAIWKRWWDARAQWRAVYPSLDMKIPRFFHDEECPDHPVAREFVAARKAYLDDLQARRNREDGVS